MSSFSAVCLPAREQHGRFHEDSGDSRECVMKAIAYEPRIRSWVSIFHRRGAEVAKERRALHVGR
jgi:hypothetical protein